MKPRFFKTPGELHRWLTDNHARVKEQWIGFHKLASRKPSVTYQEALDEALAFGWIDGLRKSLGDSSYVIRFTPRKPNSIWSAVNIARVRLLRKEGRMAGPGLAVFEARDPAKTNRYSFEQQGGSFDRAQAREFEADAEAWAFFQAQPPGYRRLATWWVISAKQPETRARRLGVLIEDSAAGRRIGVVTGRKSP
jgi:uncharacterized protein YdeI (YjbR/CyaY-like superfamily)